jgi:hypothetical protein
MEFHFIGHVTAAEMKTGFAEVNRSVATLRPGFTIFTDLTKLESMDLECAEQLSKTMDLCRERKVGAVVRVIPIPAKDIGFNILSIIHYRDGVKIRTFDTVAEARAALETETKHVKRSAR